MIQVTKAKVIQIEEHINNVREYTLEIKNEIKYSPGSFVQLTLEEVTASEIWPDSRPFSIASYEKGIIKIIIKKIGYYTTKIFNDLSLGSYCTLKYPFGNIFNINDVEGDYVFIAGGIGITPFLGIIKYLDNEGLLYKTYLFYSVKYENDLLYFSYLKTKLEDRLKIFVSQEESSSFSEGRIKLTDITKVAGLNSKIYICGGSDFNNYFKVNLLQSGFLNIYVDEWE